MKCEIKREADICEDVDIKCETIISVTSVKEEEEVSGITKFMLILTSYPFHISSMG